MQRRVMPDNWHPQDWIIVLDALDSLSRSSTEQWRKERIEQLITDIAHEQGLSPSELARQASLSGEYLESIDSEQ